MKFHGKAITGSSLLAVIGVICFATTLVAAAVIMSGSITITQTVSTNPEITMTGTATGDTLYTNEPIQYSFTASVPASLTSTTVHINVHKTTMATGDVSGDAVTVFFDGATFSVPLDTHTDANNWAGSVAIHSNGQSSGVVSAANYNSGNYVGLTYTVAADFIVTMTISGTAA